MRSTKFLFLTFILLTFVGLEACSKTNPAASNNAGTNATVLPTTVTTIKPAAPTPTETPAPIETPEPVLEPDQLDVLDTTSLVNTTGKTMLKSYTNSKGEETHTTVAIVSSKGTVIISDPADLPKKHGIPQADIVTNSHGHPDHHDSAFEARTTARMSNNSEETFTVKNVNVTGIDSSHRDNIVEAYSANSNTIYVFDVDGMRIAHMGDMGQDQLTPDQLKKLGKVDILFTRFSNKVEYGASTQKTITLITQLKPKIVLPTHYEPDIVDLILKELKITDRSEMETLSVDLKDIKAITETKFIFLN